MGKNQNFPDLSFLPTLASLFNISVDELIDYQPQMNKNEIRKLYHHCIIFKQL